MYKLSVQVVLLTLSVLPTLSAADLPLFKNRGEYNIAEQLEQERDPVRSLVLLNNWVKMYPQSAFEQERANRLVKLYQALKMGRLMLDAAIAMAAEDPHGMGNYWIALLTVSLQDSSPTALRIGRTAAEAMLQNSAATFAPSNCPTAVPLRVWIKERDREEMLAHRTLGWVYLREGQFRGAEREFTAVLRFNPNDAEASFWMGTALIGQNDSSLQTAASYRIAKSLAVSGDGALLPQAKRLVRKFYAANFNLELSPLPAFTLPVRPPQQIPEPPEASVLYPVATLMTSDSESKAASRGAFLVHPIMDAISGSD